jgi:hypothetical protein
VSRPEKTLRRDQRGAVLAEFVITFIPLMSCFFVFLQLSLVASARLRLKHAAVIGARAAAVFSNVNDNCPECCGSGQAEIEAGVRAAIGTPSNLAVSSVEVNDQSSRNDPYGLVSVTVTGRYQCGVPLGKIICGESTTTFVETKSMPHQGARYRAEYADCGGGG